MKKLNWFNIEYWLNKGFTEDEAIQEINKRKAEGSCRNKAFWLKRGFSEEEAIIKIKTLQSSSALKGIHKPKKNIYSSEYWVEKGFSKEDSLKKIEEQKLKSNMYKVLSKDKKREDFIISKGYDLLVIWEQELKQDKKNLLEKCINFIKN